MDIIIPASLMYSLIISFNPISPILKPWQLQQSADNRTQETYKMEKFKIALELATEKIMKEYELHKQTPENHPRYGDEWKVFWKRRYIQIKKEGKSDPQTYDYKAEWKGFWMNRMKVLMEKNLDDIKKELKAKIEMTDDFNSVVPARKRSPPITYETISSDSDSDSYREIQRRKKARLEQERLDERDRFYSRRNEYRRHENVPAYDPYDNQPITLISVCRLLAALESEVGSLSPKVLDLLAKAIAADKLKPNSSDKLLMTNANAVFLETVKEKMKGLLMLDIMSNCKRVAVKKSIENITQLIHQTPIRVEQPEQPQVSQWPVDPEQAKIAAKITEALVAQGKTDCTPEELEVLIEMYFEDEAQKTEVEPEASSKPEKASPPKVPKKDFKRLDGLSDDDMKILLKNFVDLTSDEQDRMIKYLTDLEKKEPLRVESLRKFMKDVVADTNEEMYTIEDDDDDYNLSEVVPAMQIPTISSYTRDQQLMPPGTQCLTDNLLAFGNKY